MSALDLALCAVFALVLPAGQLLFKWAVPTAPHGQTPLWRNWRLALACGWYLGVALLWFFILTRLPLAAAYPFALAGAALVPLLAGVVFKEPLSWRFAAGYALLLGGLWLAVLGAG